MHLLLFRLSQLEESSQKQTFNITVLYCSNLGFSWHAYCLSSLASKMQPHEMAVYIYLKLQDARKLLTFSTELIMARIVPEKT
jgi:hypothetical protein